MMKKALFILLFAAPLVLCAQVTKIDPAKSKDKDKEKKEVVKREQTDPSTQRIGELRTNEQIYVEIVVSNAGGNGAASYKVILGSNYKDVIRDKQIVEGLEAATGIRYTSSIEALNVLNALGFKLITSYDLVVRGGSETHLVLEAENRDPDIVLPEKGVGNTLSKDPGYNTKKSKG